MTMSWVPPALEPLTTGELYNYEQSMSIYLMDTISANEVETLGVDNSAITMTVEVREQTQNDADELVLESIVTCVYTSEGIQASLDTILMRYVDPTQLAFDDAELSFRPFKDSYVLDTYSNNGPTKADVGLIVATSLLTVMLVAVSSVLLYITGGWDACQQKLNNCCFEEIEDDYGIENKGTFQVGSVYDDNENGSVEESGMNATTPGVLGAQLQPTRSILMDDETAASMSTNRPLGITSMKKMQPNGQDDTGGLKHMIMHRFTSYTETQ